MIFGEDSGPVGRQMNTQMSCWRKLGPRAAVAAYPGKISSIGDQSREVFATAVRDVSSIYGARYTCTYTEYRS